ncbi:BTB/POZ domain-containing protein 16-like [Patiria miniata]|uniref:BTB/POZ domain-containing protein 16 n=1 Tax=Patiria miniata TaxID=46514 RepID=A0A914B5F2_PATMI|nr:BTB/POZ domain-containing protein 16-like [Patiria miniata]
MAEVTTVTNLSASSKHSMGGMAAHALPYLPAAPPQARMSSVAMSYTRALQNAPYTALIGVVVDARQPDRHSASPRYRIRRQVGGTNRWRLPESLGGDLLGTAQAIKSLNEPYNDGMVAVMTAENPATSVNSDPEKPYQFPPRDGIDRPHTTLDARTSNRWLNRPRSSDTKPPGTAPCRLSSPSPIEKFQPSSARSPTPVDIFHYHSAPIHSVLGPDILLQCLDTNWELHRPYIQKSATLTHLLSKAESTPHTELYYRDPMSATLDQYISKSNHYSTEYQDISHSLSLTDSPRSSSREDGEKKGIGHPAHVVRARTNTMTKLKLKVRDPMVTRDAFAVALGNLYHEDIDVEKCDVVGVLASAHTLGFQDLERRCADIMLRNLSAMTVCKYHQAGLKYKVGQVVNACERWLELNLIPHLSVQIHLRDLPLELLQKIIKSSRFFTFNEYYLYKLLCYWIFLQQNHHLQLMPSHSTIVTFFNSLSKTTSFVEREQGQQYASLFRSIRLAGVTDTRHLDDMLRMNVIPQQWILKTLSLHYHALQGGGDMSLMLNFGNDAIRTGFIIQQEPRYHSEVVSIHGFHFELKAHRQGKHSTYQFYMQRLKPHDPTLSFRICERQTFSLRQDREVLYSIRIQCHLPGQDYIYNTGILSKKFGLGSKTSRSEVLSLDGLCLPIYVTFSILFPPS